jgi:uncharacterized membrane protein
LKYAIVIVTPWKCDSLMTWYLLVVSLHIFVAMIWTGYILFWGIVIGPLSRPSAVPHSAEMLRMIDRSMWPPALIPHAFRLRFPWLGWVALLMLGATGAYLLYLRGVSLESFVSGALFRSPFGRVLAVKLLLLIGLAIGQLVLSSQPSPKLVYPTLVLTLAVIALSALLVH